MKILPIVYVTDMNKAIEFYTTLGLQLDYQQRNDMWTELGSGEQMLALHYANPLPHNAQGRVELAMRATEPLESVLARLHQAGIEPYRGIADEGFGRSIQVQDPDGMVIQISEIDPDLTRQQGK